MKESKFTVGDVVHIRSVHGSQYNADFATVTEVEWAGPYVMQSGYIGYVYRTNKDPYPPEDGAWHWEQSLKPIPLNKDFDDAQDFVKKLIGKKVEIPVACSS